MNPPDNLPPLPPVPEGFSRWEYRGEAWRGSLCIYASWTDARTDWICSSLPATPLGAEGCHYIEAVREPAKDQPPHPGAPLESLQGLENLRHYESKAFTKSFAVGGSEPAKERVPLSTRTIPPRVEPAKEPAKDEACPVKHCANCDISAQWSTADCPICFGHLTEVEPAKDYTNSTNQGEVEMMDEPANEPSAGDLPPPVDPAVILERIRAKLPPLESTSVERELARNGVMLVDCNLSESTGVESIATREWCVKSAEIEGEAEIGAGTPTGVEARVCEDGWRPIDGKVNGIIFAVSNDGGKTGVAWRDDVHEALAYRDMQGGDYAVVAVRRTPPAERSDHE